MNKDDVIAGARYDDAVRELDARYRAYVAAVARDVTAERRAEQTAQKEQLIRMVVQEELERSQRHGASFVVGGRCFADGQGDDAFRLAFSFQPAERIPEGIARIGAALRELL